MKKNKKRKQPEINPPDSNTPEPPWLYDTPSDIIGPYSDEELDLFVEGFIQAHSDTQAWKDLVKKVGKEEALQVLRNSFRSADTRKSRKKILVH
jgi:hypothetical protein